MRQIYDLIMNEEKNPLRRLPPAQRYQVMALLSVMWTTAFCVGIGSWTYYGEIMVLHIAVLTGISVTALTFRQVAITTHRDKYRNSDGTAKYDDLWGG
tara:strand:+ start:166 stop:459 length:294 start_codon:yes stop_codon:yes gene_type:complete